MVGSRLPQCIVALHTLETDQDILHGVIERMSHMQLSGNVWWRHHNGERLFAPVYLRVKIFVCNPLIIQTRFNLRRVVVLL